MYSKGEVVWAKIKGFPWWPGVVAKVQEDREDSSKLTEILVNFIGENSHARLGLDKVAKFEENFTEYAKMKKKKLVESIEIAQRIINGETTYEEESDRLEKMNRTKSSSVENKSPIHLQGAKTKPNGGKHSAEKDLSSSSDSDSEPSHRSPIPPKSTQSDKKKVKPIEKKDPVKKPPIINNPAKSPISTSADRSPMIVKNVRPMVPPHMTIITPSPIPKETDSKDPAKNRAKKLLKLEELDDSRLLKVPPTQPIAKTPADIILEPERRSERNVPKPIKTQPLFEGLLEEFVEMISNKSLKSFPQVSKKLETAIKKLEYDSAPVPDLIEKELGKNLHTFLALVDKLAEIEAEEEEDDNISRLRDFIIEAKNIFESRITRYYVENADYVSHWLRKIDDRADHKESDQETKVTKESESSFSHNPPIVREGSTTNKGLDLESESSPKENNEKFDDEVPPVNEEEKAHTEPSPKDTDDQKNSKNDLKNQPTSSTKLVKERSKAESVQSKKSETAKPEQPQIKLSEQTQSIRKKICVKMCKLIQDKYSLPREDAQKLTLEIEKKVSKVDPHITGEYKSNILTILKSIKYSLCDARELAKSELNFSELKKKVEDYQKENVGEQDNIGIGDDLTLNKETKSDMEILNGEGVTVGVSN